MKSASFGRNPFKTLWNIELQVELTPWVGLLWPVTPRHVVRRQGHFRSWKVTSSFSGITFDKNQLELWKHHRCVQADDADRLICNMTFSGQVMTLTWGQFFNMTFQEQIIYHSMRLDERNMMMAKEMLCLYWVKSYYRKKCFFLQKNGYFWSVCSLEAKLLILDQIWGHTSERALKELSNALSRSTVALLVPELSASLSKKCWNMPNLTFGDLWWPDLWPDLKNDWSSFVMIFDALSNAAYRVSLRGLGAEIEGGSQHHPAWWKI